MNKIKVITDSTVELSREEIDTLGIIRIPLTATLNGKTYYDRETISEEEYFKLLSESEVLPKTSQPSLGAFEDTYHHWIDQGYDILSIHVTEALSGTVNTARNVANILEKGRVVVIDTTFCARAQAFQVLEAARLAKAGELSLDEIVDRVQSVRERSELYIAVTHLENLVKGGRLSKAAGFITSLFNIKILARLEPDKLVPTVKGRGVKPILKEMKQIFDDWKSNHTIEAIGITHTGLADYSREIIAYAKEQNPGVEVFVSPASASVATHAGIEGVSIQCLFAE